MELPAEGSVAKSIVPPHSVPTYIVPTITAFTNLAWTSFVNRESNKCEQSVASFLGITHSNY